MGTVTHSEDSRLSVGDLYCGAGGFSEGFRQAGFRVAWGVDYWHPAAETFSMNFPDAIVLERDILKIETSELEPVDVLIGSPPCVHFSPANRGGGGDRAKGMAYVRRFLDIARQLRPKYWVMENVPAMLTDLTSHMKESTFIDERGGWRIEIPKIQILDSQVFSVPQVRKRLFSGSFPSPRLGALAGDAPITPLRSVIEALPPPELGLESRFRSIFDPVYPGQKVKIDELRNHFEDTRWRLSESDLRSARRAKLQNPVYGKMPFPDSLDRPARTITATRTRGSRATIVVAGQSGLRTLTTRECASVQGFPIRYQFWGTRVGQNDFLVGNAVCPPVSRALANAITLEEGIRSGDELVLPEPVRLAPIVKVRRTWRRHFSLRRRFRGIVPIDWRHDHRVELDNEPPVVEGVLPPDVVPPITWRTRLYLGYATKYKQYDLDLIAAVELVRAATSREYIHLPREPIRRAALSTVNYALNGFPDGLALQIAWAGRSSSQVSPDILVSEIGEIVEQALPAVDWSGQLMPAALTSAILESCSRAHGTAAGEGQPVDLSPRLMLAAFLLSIYCAGLNNRRAELAALKHDVSRRRPFEFRRLLGRISSASQKTRSRTRQTAFAF